MVMAVGGAERGESVVDLSSGQVKLVEECSDRGVGHGADAIGPGLEGLVEVADRPRDASGFLDVVAGDLDQRLRLLFDHIHRSVGFMHRVAVGEGMVQVKAKPCAVLGFGPESPPGQLLAVNRDGNTDKGGRASRRRGWRTRIMMDQNRK